MARKLSWTEKAGIFAFQRHDEGFAQKWVWSHRFEKLLDQSVCILHKTASSAYNQFGDNLTN